MSKSTPAWLLDCGGGVHVAVALPSLLHLIEDTTLVQRVPVVPRHLGQVLLWQERCLAVVDLCLQLGRPLSSAARTYVCLLGWCNGKGESDYGGLLVRKLPRRVQITDQALATPTVQMASDWQGLALTYFDLQGHIFPIIAPAALFEPAARTERAASSGQAPQRKDMRSA
jgi:chemotaxis signal transduction protein